MARGYGYSSANTTGRRTRSVRGWTSEGNGAGDSTDDSVGPDDDLDVDRSTEPAPARGERVAQRLLDALAEPPEIRAVLGAGAARADGTAARDRERKAVTRIGGAAGHTTARAQAHRDAALSRRYVRVPGERRRRCGAGGSVRGRIRRLRNLRCRVGPGCRRELGRGQGRRRRGRRCTGAARRCGLGGGRRLGSASQYWGRWR